MFEVPIAPVALKKVAKFLLAVLFVTGSMTASVPAALILNNGFEGGTADWGTSGDWHKSTGNVQVSPIAREGTKSVQFFPNPTNVNDRRSEFTVSGSDGAYNWGTEYWQGFSLRVVQPVHGFSVIFQHHSTPATIGGSVDWSFSSGECFIIRTDFTAPNTFNIYTATDPNKVFVIPSQSATSGTKLVSIPYVTNRWYDFVLHFRLATNNTGIMQVWIKDTVTGVTNQLVNVTAGPTVYAYDSCPTNSGGPRLKTPVNNQKIGLYYGPGNEDIAGTVIYDAFRTWEGPGGSYAAVAPGGDVSVPPAAPSALTAPLIISNQINLVWTDNSTNETQFRLERKLGGGVFAFLTNRPAIAGTGGSGSYLDTNLNAGTTYTYRVRADGSNGNDSAWSSEVSTNTPGGSGGGGLTNFYEAELLAIVGTSAGDPTENFAEPNASGGTNSLLTANAVGDFIIYTVGVPWVGTYNLRVMLNKAGNRGKCNLYLDGGVTSQGGERDLYNASGYAYEEVDQGNVTFTNTGNHTFRFQVSGKHASATAYKLAFDYLKLIYADTNVPTVSISAPASGATVAGPGIGVTAAAADNVGVVGVQFKLDGVNLDEEVTSNPFSIVWDTTTASEGSHTLTAVARDASGNLTTSSVVAVTVNNEPDIPVEIGPPVITGAAVSNNNFVLSFTTEVGGQYQVQRTETLSPPAWTTIATNIHGNDSEIQITDTNALIRPGTFYRIKQGQ